MIAAAPRTGIVTHEGWSGVLRLDLLANPFAPAPVVRRALKDQIHLNLVTARLEAILTARLARRHQVSPKCIFLAPDIHSLIERLDVSKPDFHDLSGAFDYAPGNGEWEQGRQTGSSVYVMSPSDPLGSLLRLQQAVRLARSSRMLVIDERHAGYAPRDHLPLFKEFENVVLLRTLEYWGGLIEMPIGYAIAHPAASGELRAHPHEGELDRLRLSTGIATIEHERYLDAAARRIALERVNLIRSLRKLNMVRPFPSAANFVCARLERGERSDLRRYLEERDIVVHYPHQPGMERMIRVSAVSPAATSVLCDALIAWAREI